MRPGAAVEVVDGVFRGCTGVVVEAGAELWAGWWRVRLDGREVAPQLLHPDQLRTIAQSGRAGAPAQASLF